MNATDKLAIAKARMQGATLAKIQEIYPTADREAVCEACKFAEANMPQRPQFFGYDDPKETHSGLPVCIRATIVVDEIDRIPLAFIAPYDCK